MVILDPKSCLERFPIRGFLLFLMLTSTGVFVCSVYKLHRVRTGSFRYSEISQIRSVEGENLGYDEVELLKKDLHEVIRSENQELIQQLFSRINLAPVVERDTLGNAQNISVIKRSNISRGSTLVDPQKKVPEQRLLTKAYWGRGWQSVVDNDAKAREYIERFESTCESYDSLEEIIKRRGAASVNQSMPLCPCVPATLVGKHKPDLDGLMSTTWQQTAPIADTVVLGGSWRPTDCTARRRVAIIVPCRDREQQLRAFLTHMHPLLQRQLLDYRVFVVEQTWPPIFNKAAIMNAAFLEASRGYKFDCVMFHDVDLLPEDDRSVIYCGVPALHYGAHLDKWGYNIGYARIFGGAVSLTRQQFIKANGYSNSYYGWGGEDDEFDKRVRAAGYEIARPPPEVSRHSVLTHSRDKANPVNPGSSLSWYNRPSVYPNEGLNSVQYDLQSTTLEPLYTIFMVKLKVPAERNLIAQVPYNYALVDGACVQPLTQEDIIEQLPLSLTSCRYQCDFNPSCRMFMYYDHMDDHCVLLRALCKIDISVLEATVYIKEFNPKDAPFSVQLGDCHGNDIEGLQVPLTKCMTICKENAACRGFVYGELLSSQCWLKNGTCEQAKPNLLGVRSYTRLK